MAGHLLRLLVIILGISHLFSLNNAVPLTRPGRLRHGNGQVLPVSEKNLLQVAKEKTWEQHLNVGGSRVAVELNDYPGPGANNRHTPRPQFGRCVDC